MSKEETGIDEMWTPVLPNCSESKSPCLPCICAALCGQQQGFWQCHLHWWKHNLVGVPCLSKILSFQVNIWSDIWKECNSSPHFNWYHEKRVLHRGDTGKSAVALYAEYVPRRRLSIGSSRMTILNIKVSSLLFLFFLVTQQHSFLKTKPFVLFQYKL